jgi:hypothetical protein
MAWTFGKAEHLDGNALLVFVVFRGELHRLDALLAEEDTAVEEESVCGGGI